MLNKENTTIYRVDFEQGWILIVYYLVDAFNIVLCYKRLVREKNIYNFYGYYLVETVILGNNSRYNKHRLFSEEG